MEARGGSGATWSDIAPANLPGDVAAQWQTVFEYPVGVADDAEPPIPVLGKNFETH